MKIYTRVVAKWDGSRYVTTETEWHHHNGPVALCCGASNQQTQTYNQQAGLSQQMSSQAQGIFGNSSAVFNDLNSSLAPTVAAGPDQQGFSPTELAAQNASVINNGGVAARNAKSAVGDAMAAQNGGNTSGTTAGSTAGIDANVATQSAENTANQENQVQQLNYATGRQNYDTAVGALESAPGVFNAATSAGTAASGALENQSNTANQIAQENQSWVQGVTGALGGIAGATVTGGMKNLGSGAGFFGQNAPAPGS